MPCFFCMVRKFGSAATLVSPLLRAAGPLDFGAAGPADLLPRPNRHSQIALRAVTAPLAPRSTGLPEAAFNAYTRRLPSRLDFVPTRRTHQKPVCDYRRRYGKIRGGRDWSRSARPDPQSGRIGICPRRAPRWRGESPGPSKRLTVLESGACRDCGIGSGASLYCTLGCTRPISSSMCPLAAKISGLPSKCNRRRTHPRRQGSAGSPRPDGGRTAASSTNKPVALLC